MAGSKNMVSRTARPTMAQVRQMVNSKLTQNLEFKHLSISSSGSIGTGGTMFPLTQGIVQGDDASERSGEAITVVEVDFNAFASTNTSSSGTQFVRAILFRDAFNNANTPSVADVISTTNVTSTYADEVWKTKRIVILADHTFSVGPVNGAFNKTVSRKIKINKKVFYQGTTDVAASNGPNSLWLYVWSTTSTNSPAFQGNTLVKFHDA